MNVFSDLDTLHGNSVHKESVFCKGARTYARKLQFQCALAKIALLYVNPKTLTLDLGEKEGLELRVPWRLPGASGNAYPRIQMCKLTRVRDLEP